MLDNCSEKVRSSFVGLLAGCVPVPAPLTLDESAAPRDSIAPDSGVRNSDQDDEQEPLTLRTEAETDQTLSMQWSTACLHMLVDGLRLSPHYVEAYESIMTYPTELEEAMQKHAMMCSFVQSIILNNDSSVATSFDCSPTAMIIDLTVFLVMKGQYDARGRCLVRSAGALLNVPMDKIYHIEEKIASYLHAVEDVLSQRASTEQAKQQHSKWRYAKIGAASLGAGALLAITGGLAAPAIAAGVLLVSTSSAAASVSAFATVAVMATIFGSTGAGLAGYKMMRRTRGLSEFAFEQYGGQVCHVAMEK